MVTDQALEGSLVAPRQDTTEQTHALAGLEVSGVDGQLVGSIKEVRGADFLVHRAIRRDVYVPFSEVREVHGNVVVLKITADQVDDMDWEKPPLVG